MNNRKYPYISGSIKLLPKHGDPGVCTFPSCSHKATRRMTIQTSWFRGDDIDVHRCDEHSQQLSSSSDARVQKVLTAPEKLKEAAISFTIHNGGQHLIVESKYDFWPSSGLWIERGQKKRSSGIQNLIDTIKKR